LSERAETGCGNGRNGDKQLSTRHSADYIGRVGRVSPVSRVSWTHLTTYLPHPTYLTYQTFVNMGLERTIP
jgi:hypothetical protein